LKRPRQLLDAAPELGLGLPQFVNLVAQGDDLCKDAIEVRRWGHRSRTSTRLHTLSRRRSDCGPGRTLGLGWVSTTGPKRASRSDLGGGPGSLGLPAL
jgi:hypothetical protein